MKKLQPIDVSIAIKPMMFISKKMAISVRIAILKAIGKKSVSITNGIQTSPYAVSINNSSAITVIKAAL